MDNPGMVLIDCVATALVLERSALVLVSSKGPAPERCGQAELECPACGEPLGVPLPRRQSLEKQTQPKEPAATLEAARRKA